MQFRARPSHHRVSLLIPAKNEERNLAWVLARVPPIVDEVILIDGHSTDRTVEVARAIRPDIVVVTEKGPGKGAAVRTGIEAAAGELLVMIDADGSMDPTEIPRFVEALETGADLVKGSRFLPGGGTADITRLRMCGNRALLAIANAIFRTRFTELCYGYMAFRREAMLGLGLTSNGFEIETEIVVRSALHGLRIAEIPSFEFERRFGTSNLNTFRDGMRVLRTILGQRTSWAPPAVGPVALPLAESDVPVTLLPAVDEEPTEALTA